MKVSPEKNVKKVDGIYNSFFLVNAAASNEEVLSPISTIS